MEATRSKRSEAPVMWRQRLNLRHCSGQSVDAVPFRRPRLYVVGFCVNRLGMERSAPRNITAHIRKLADWPTELSWHDFETDVEDV